MCVCNFFSRTLCVCVCVCVCASVLFLWLCMFESRRSAFLNRPLSLTHRFIQMEKSSNARSRSSTKKATIILFHSLSLLKKRSRELERAFFNFVCPAWCTRKLRSAELQARSIIRKKSFWDRIDLNTTSAFFKTNIVFGLK
jgi:hypothetical protein